MQVQGAPDGFPRKGHAAWMPLRASHSVACELVEPKSPVWIALAPTHPTSARPHLSILLLFCSLQCQQQCRLDECGSDSDGD